MISVKSFLYSFEVDCKSNYSFEVFNFITKSDNVLLIIKVVLLLYVIYVNQMDPSHIFFISKDDWFIYLLIIKI